MKRKVEVLGYEFEIDVVQIKKTVWHAYGTYQERHILGQGRSDNEAIQKWISGAISRASE